MAITEPSLETIRTAVDSSRSPSCPRAAASELAYPGTAAGLVIPPSCDAELVAFWVEHHDMTEVLAVGLLADSRSPGGDQLGWCVWRGRVPLLRVTGDRTGRPSGRRRRRDGGTSNQPSSRIATHRQPQAPSRRAPPAGTTRAQSELGVSWCPRYRCPHPFRHSTRTSEHRKDPPGMTNSRTQLQVRLSPIS